MSRLRESVLSDCNGCGAISEAFPAVRQAARSQSASAPQPSNASTALNLGEEVLEKVLDSVPQRRRRGGAAGAGALHLEIDDSLAVALEDDVAAVAGDRRADAGLDQFLDRLDLLLVLGIEELAGRDRVGAARFDQRRAGEIELGHDAEHGGPQMLPFALGLGHRDEVVGEEHAAHARQLHQRLGERRALGLSDVARLERPLIHHRPSGKEFEGRRIGGGFGLDEHGRTPQH